MIEEIESERLLNMIRVNHCGCDSKHMPPFEMLRRDGSRDYTILLVKTEACFWLDGTLHETGPNMAILYDKDVPVRYGCADSMYSDDWLHFDLTLDEDILDQLQIPFQTPLYPADFPMLSGYLRMLVWQTHAKGLHSDEITDAMMRTLLYSLDSQILGLPKKQVLHKHYATMQHLKARIYNSPELIWSVEQMAELVHMSPSYFQHLYKEIFGISCRQDVILARMERAKFFLNSTDMPVLMIAEACGYENAVHFMRQFKKSEGMTPTEYRAFFSSGRSR